jgi:formylglycine-generating enzyme required for sulfatase activity
LIEAADTIVFVMSPDAVAYERCAWEVERTVTLKKRLLPIVWRRVDEAQCRPALSSFSVLTTTQEKDIAAKPGSDFKECANGCPTMIVVPAGKFTMGSPETEKGRSSDDGPQHEVTICRSLRRGQDRRHVRRL